MTIRSPKITSKVYFTTNRKLVRLIIHEILDKLSSCCLSEHPLGLHTFFVRAQQLVRANIIGERKFFQWDIQLTFNYQNTQEPRPLLLAYNTCTVVNVKCIYVSAKSDRTRLISINKSPIIIVFMNKSLILAVVIVCLFLDLIFGSDV